MFKLITFFILFTVSPVFSSNLNPIDYFKKDSSIKAKISTNEILIDKIIHNLEGKQEMPNKGIIPLAISGYFKLLKNGSIKSGSPLSIIDFSLPSSRKRLWVIDVEDGSLLHHSLVSHGRNSGGLMAKNFSNVNSSFMSSLGFYVTGKTYQGKHGYSLRLDGVEKGFNHNARERAIVMHGAEYADEDFVEEIGRLGRSLGCPALPMKLHKEIIDTIKEKTCLFIYGKDPNYLKKSSLIH